jgi:DNA-directed RNA polymerase specialized sigma24 family protein
VTGVSEGTVGATLHAAHRALRERLQEVPVP